MFNDPKQVLQAWLSGVNSGNLHDVLSLYSADAVLLPTFSDKCLVNPKDFKAYFERLASHKNLDVQLHEKTLVIQDFSPKLYSMSGIYAWRFEVDGENLNFEARFTLTVDLNRSRPIVHHHSSQVPEMLW